MDAKLEGVEVEVAVVGDDEFPIEDALFGELVAKGREHLGEVAIERFLVAALEEDFIAIAEDEDAEAVTLWLVDPFAFGGYGVDAFGEHREERRINSELHRRC